MTARARKAVKPRIAALLTSKRPDWNTPPEVLALVRRVGPIALDPCSNRRSIVGALRELRAPKRDGLAALWTNVIDCEGGGLVYVNPPYGREIGPWMAKCDVEARNGAEIIALVPARTDTAWFQHCWRADAICFWRGRLTFLGAPAGAPFPSAVVYWGPRPDRFARVFDDAGAIRFGPTVGAITLTPAARGA